jgi:NAD(P)-dependent dehydrogenase (short-subunit alcohol dehydrogenase family)
MDTVFNGKKALVIGGSSGIGRSIALALCASGASVCIIGRKVLPGIESIVMDLDNPDNLDIILARVKNTDILCSIRGPFLQKAIHEMITDEWSSVVYANLTFPGILVSTAVPHMREAKWGRILLFGGTRTEAVRGFRTNAAYAAAKTGLSSLVKSVALSYAGEGITCNALCPGFVDTGSLDLELKERLSRKNPDGMLVSLQEITESALFLLEKSVFNGVILNVDKGWTPADI